MTDRKNEKPTNGFLKIVPLKNLSDELNRPDNQMNRNISRTVIGSTLIANSIGGNETIWRQLAPTDFLPRLFSTLQIVLNKIWHLKETADISTSLD